MSTPAGEEAGSELEPSPPQSPGNRGCLSTAEVTLKFPRFLKLCLCLAFISAGRSLVLEGGLWFHTSSFYSYFPTPFLIVFSQKIFCNEKLIHAYD